MFIEDIPAPKLLGLIITVGILFIFYKLIVLTTKRREDMYIQEGQLKNYLFSTVFDVGKTKPAQRIKLG